MNTKHNHRRINRDTIRVAFQLPGSYDLKPFKIWRIRPHHEIHDFCLDGFFLDDPKTRSRTVVTHAKAGDIIMITFTPTEDTAPVPAGFRINCKGEPKMVDELPALASYEMISPGPVMDFDGRQFIHASEQDLRAFMQARHPAWLQDQVNATLRSWRTEAPDLFIKVAPAHLLGKKIWLLAYHDPRKALENHSGDLGKDLRRFCVHRLVPNRNRTRTFNCALPDALKPPHQYSNAAYLLDHHLPELDDTQIRICAYKNPQAALARYPRVTALRIRALLLSCAFRHAWPNRALMADLAFHRDVIESVIEHPNEWTTSNPEGLVAVLRLIAQRIPFRPTSDELNQMINGLDPVLRQSVAEFTAARI
jgi:hypothetical protein